MSEAFGPITPESTQVAAAAAQAKLTAGIEQKADANASTLVPNNIGALKKEAPEMYELMKEAIAQRILSDLRRASRRIREAIRKGRQRH